MVAVQENFAGVGRINREPLLLLNREGDCLAAKLSPATRDDVRGLRRNGPKLQLALTQKVHPSYGYY